jgi:hypothetical protein
MRIFFTAFLVLISSFPALASEERRILFLDGARIEREMVARKGVIEVPLPAAMLPDSLRVKPLGSAQVRWVEIVPVPGNGKYADQLKAMEERRKNLLDRLKNLDLREEIFKAAAKSQSGRALRKTKTNPDPLGSLRSGTRYALTQLDEISAARRQTRGSLAELETRIATLAKQPLRGSVARILLSQSGGTVRVAYLVSNLKWTPRYDVRLSGDGFTELALCAKMPAGTQTLSMSVVPLPLAESFGTEIHPYPISAGITTIATFKLPLVKEELIKGAVPYLSLVLDNTSSQYLPAGEASGFWGGEYLGHATFAGCLPGKSLSLHFGKRQSISP